ncbi:3-oxo-tetronate 4-phosphate decarboxylase [Propionivibrio soli]|uniref:3-oxo-tetronate 4-phosphate decarboxylase n=1 Tax=Propionivibrio soli TaxID=2976531 RepID=UPI0021E99A83|nr:3-oxo-tetronate 4-phosphate decarboxylase [Propionivibrio soli]
MTALMHTEENRQREKIATLSRSLYERGLTAGSSGNISVRLEDGWLLTPTNSCLGELDPARIAKLDWNGTLLAGDPPSKEAFLHRSMYEARPKAGAIVHLHSTHSAAVSCMGGLDRENCIPPLTPYFVMKIGRLPLVPYHRPGDKALGDVIRGLAARHGAVLLANHGPVVSGPDLEGAIYASEELEETAKIFLLLRNTSVHCLNDEQIDELKTVFKLDI